MFRETVGHLRDLPRYRQILATLIHYGYQDVVSALHLKGIVRPLERAALGDSVPPEDRPRRVRMICEELGPTFVKLGQLLASRPDLVPEPYLLELQRLRDEVKPFPYEEVVAILREDLGGEPDVLFAMIDPVPVASASISQVHKARLHDGELVALKIRRPGIDAVVNSDLDILKNLSQLAQRRLPNLQPYQPQALVHEFERSIRRELDLGIERRTMQRCRIQLERDPHAYVPRVHAAYCSSRVLCMEFIEGIDIDDLDAMRGCGLDPPLIAARGADLLLTQIFRFGFFHADPHPGNLRVLPEGIIVPLDYGLFGQLDARVRERIADLLLGLLAIDTERVMRALEDLDIRGTEVDHRMLERDLGELVASYSDLTLDNIDLGRLLGELIALIRTHRLRIPPDLVLLIRALVSIESVGRHLDPHFDIAKHLQPFLRDMMLRRFHPMRLLTRVARTGDEVQRIASLLPDLLGQLLDSVRRGELRVQFDVHHFEDLVDRLTRASHNLSSAIIIAGLLVGSSLIVRAGVGPTTIGYIGFGAAALLGLGLLLNIMRGR